MAPIVLASASPRRRALLESLGVAFAVVSADVDELTGAQEADPRRLVVVNSLRKAAAVEVSSPAAVVVAVDTVVVSSSGQVLGKPGDDTAARAMLNELSGQCCTVLTGLAVRRGSSAPRSSVTATDLHVRRFTAGDLDAYVASGAPLGKAGGLSIQSHEELLIEQRIGCPTNVVGLPLCTLASMVGPPMSSRWSCSPHCVAAAASPGVRVT